jgi:iron complex outermembrane receptor protein
MGWQINRKVSTAFLLVVGFVCVGGAIARDAVGGEDGEAEVSQAPANETPGGEEARRLRREERVTVTATRLPAGEQDLASVAAPVTVFTREQIEASGASTVQEFLAGHASFNVFDQVGNEVQSTVALRGFSSDTAMALVVDGVRFNEPDDNRAAFDLIPLAEVERIEVVRGSYSSIYGGGSLAGVIHVITRAAAAPIEASVAAGSYGANAQRVAGGGEAGAISWFAAADRAAADGYRESAATETLAGLARLDWRLRPQSTLTFSYRHGENDLGAGGALTEAEIDADPRQNVFNRPDFEDSSLDLALIEFRTDLPAGFDLRVGTSFRSNDVTILTTGRTAAAFGSGFRTETTYDTLGLALQAGHQWRGERIGSTLAFGGELRSSDFGADGFFTDPAGENPSLTTTNATDERIAGAFVEESLALGRRVSLSGGARYDSVRLDFTQDDAFSGVTDGETTFTAWSPRLGVNWNPIERTGLYASLSRSFLAPTVTQLFAFVGFGSNPDLEPQTSTGLEVGVRQEIGASGRLTANVFRIEVDDEIQFVFTDPAFFLGENENIGRTRREGIEMTLAGPLAPRLRGSIEYTLTDAVFREDVDRNSDGVISALPDPITGVLDIPEGSALTMVPRHRATASLAWELPAGFALEARGLFVSSQPLTGDDAGTREDLPSYEVLDLGVLYRRPHWDLKLRVENALDAQYETRGISSGTEDFFTPAPDRRFSAGVVFRL